MNARFVIAQGIDAVVGGNPDRHSQRPITLAEIQPNILKLEKPQNGQAVTFHADGQTRIDFSDVASEKLTFVRVGDRLVVLFDNQATVTIDGVFDPSGHPLPNIAFEMAPDRMLTGDQFADLFPITTDQSVLPAAGGNGPTAGAHFGDPIVDALPTFTALDLLGASQASGANFGAHTDVPLPTHLPAATPDTATVVEAGVHPTNVPFAGTLVATGNVLTNDIFLDATAVKVVIGVAVGTESAATGNVGAVLTGSYGSLVLGADGNYTYTLDNANPAVLALAQGQQAFDVFTYSMSDSLGHASTTTLTIDVVGTDHAPVIASADKVESGAPIVEAVLVTNDPTLHVETGTIHFTDLNLTDRPTATVTSQTVTYTAGSGDEGHKTLTLSAAELAAIEQAFTVTAAPGNTNNGAVNWTYSIADNALDFLSQGETVTLVSTVVIDDHNGGTDTATVTITIDGSDDTPRITSGAESAAFGELTGQTASSTADTKTGVLTFTDVDLNDRHFVGVSLASTTWSEGANHTAIPSATQTALNSALQTVLTDSTGTGSGSINWTFSLPDSDFDFLAKNETLKLTYDVTVTDLSGPVVDPDRHHHGDRQQRRAKLRQLAGDGQGGGAGRPDSLAVARPRQRHAQLYRRRSQQCRPHCQGHQRRRQRRDQRAVARVPRHARGTGLLPHR